MLNEKENIIKEKRKVEAIKNNLMGISGKLGIIAKIMGQPIVSQEEVGFSSVSYSYEDLFDQEQDQILTSNIIDQFGNEIQEPDWATKKNKKEYYTSKLGYYYYGLTNGLDLEIKFLNENQELIVNYQGYMVYQEIEGDLFCYNPSEEWIDKIEKLYKKCKQQIDLKNQSLKEEKLETNKNEKIKWIEKMKKLWGI
mgnify:CR=1 FL=1